MVANSQGNSLTVVPVDQAEAADVQLGTPRGPMSRRGLGPLRNGAVENIDQVAVVDLQQGLVQRIPLPAGSGATGAIMLNDSIGYVASSRDTVSQINVLSREIAEYLSV